MVPAQLSEVLLSIIMCYGVLIYLVTATYCVAVALQCRITVESTAMGKFIVRYGQFTVALWGSICTLLLLRKIGMLLLA